MDEIDIFCYKYKYLYCYLNELLCWGCGGLCTAPASPPGSTSGGGCSDGVQGKDPA